MADKVEKILDIKVNYNEAIKAIAEYQTKIDKAKEAEAKLKEQLKAGDIKRQQYNEEMAASKAYINDCNDSIRIITKTMQNQLKQEKAQENSLVSLRAKLSNLTAEYDALSEAERNAATGIKLRDKINEVTDALKDAEEETQRYYRNVGNYKEAIMEAANANIPFVQQINVMVTSLGGVRNYLSGVKTEMLTVSTTTTGWIKVLKLLKVALLGTGIGVLIVALGSLVSWFTKTQKGVEAANKIMGALGTTVNVLIDRAGKLGSALVNLFTGNFKQAGNDAKSIFAGIGDEIVNETKQAWKLAEVLNEIDKREVMLSMSRAANRAEIEKLKKAADDQTLSTQERIKAAEKAAAMEKEDLKIQTDLAKARIANMLGYTKVTKEALKTIEDMQKGAITADEAIGKIGISESTIDDLRKLSEEVNRLSELEESSYTRQTEQQNTLNSIRQEGADKAKEAKQTELEAVRAAEDAMLALVKDKREQARKEIELNYSRQIEDLQISLKQEENLTAKAREAINAKIKALEQQKSMELSKLSDEELKKELENRLKMISLQLESVKEGSEQEYQLKIQQLQAQQEAELTSTEQTEEMKLAIKAKYNTKIDELATVHEQDIINKQQEAMRIRFETEIAQAYDNEEEILRIRMEQKKAELDSLQQMEGESIEAFNLRKLEAQNAYLESKKELSDKEIEIEQTKYEAMEQVTNGLVALTEQIGESDRGFAMASKMLALAEIAINSGKAIAKMVSAESGKGILGIATMASGIATILSNIANAVKIVKSAKFAEGGLVTGPGTGTSDSIPAQLSNGESVITAKATSMFAPILSSFNMMGGGVPINVTATNNQTLGEDMLARAVAKGMMMAPAPVVSVEEFTSVANRIKYIEESGSL
ncbi:hypothetical protein [Phocaeicola vulgatus]|uniref:hypothetical protein n=1 Tax=Phocaeicola vulgatus TaxID=821 RepID=UPI0039B5F912